MPKTTVDEDYFAAAWQNDIGFAGQVATVQPKTIPHCMQHFSNSQLRGRVF